MQKTRSVYKSSCQIIPMNVTYGKLKKLGMQHESIAKLDDKGRIVIPTKVRKNNASGRYFLCTFKDMIILREV